MLRDDSQLISDIYTPRKDTPRRDLSDLHSPRRAELGEDGADSMWRRDQEIGKLPSMQLRPPASAVSAASADEQDEVSL
jgi:hypothetical protein